MSADTSKMEEVINKPDDQFRDTLIDLVDYGKETSEKEALMKELYQNQTSNHSHVKPAASINSSTYSSAASSSSSSSSSNSSTNSASSTSSTLSSPSQSNLTASKPSNDRDNDNPTKANGNELEDFEMAILEDLGKQATIVEHRADDVTTRYLKNFVATTTSSIQFHDSLTYRPTSVEDHRSRPTSHNISSLKNSGLRKKRPIEQPVLSEDIPGYKGEQEVEWLVNFIESKVSNQHPNKKNGSNNSNNKKAKSQPKKSSQSDTERDTTVQQSRKSSNTNGSSTNTNNNNATNNSSIVASTTNISSNNNNTNTTNTVVNAKPTLSNHQRPSQNNQNKSTQINNQSTVASHSSQKKSQPPTSLNIQSQQQQQQQTNNQITNNSVANSNKPSKPSRLFKESSNASQSGGHKPNAKSANTNKQTQDNSKLSKEKYSKNNDNNVVTFADHIKITDDNETAQYTFGFFEEQEPKSTSRSSDQRRYVSKDNIDANSFNYQQIIEFISNAWKQSVAVNMTNVSERTIQ